MTFTLRFRSPGCALRLSRLLLAVAALVLSGFARGEETAAAKSPASGGVKFDLEALGNVPEIFPADDLKADGVRSLYYEGVPWNGKSTRVFAYIGLPEIKNAGDKVPAMVLIHGGGGTAFDRWVKVWAARGYAAIAMDLCGCIPVGTYGNWKRHDQGGPPGWDASFTQLDAPVHDQWTYQAVSAAVLGHSLLRSLPEVDPERIGVTGISWGGYLTSIVSGVDSRFRFAAPVYGCGYLGENSAWLPAFEKLGPEKAKLWLTQWDPSEYLGRGKMPMLWVNGTNDFAYPMDSWRKSSLLPQGPRTLCLRVRMPHGHGPAGENPEEIHRFANSILKGESPLQRIVEQGETDGEVWATFESSVPITKAELNLTRDAGRWQDRKWESIPAELDLTAKRIHAKVPSDATTFYLNLFDDRNCAVSTEHVERK